MLHSQSRSKHFRLHTEFWHWRDGKIAQRLEQHPEPQCYKDCYFHKFHELCDIPEESPLEASNPRRPKKHGNPPLTVGRITSIYPRPTSDEGLLNNTLYRCNQEDLSVVTTMTDNTRFRSADGVCVVLDNKAVEERIAKWQDQQRRIHLSITGNTYQPRSRSALTRLEKVLDNCVHQRETNQHPPREQRTLRYYAQHEGPLPPFIDTAGPSAHYLARRDVPRRGLKFKKNKKNEHSSWMNLKEDVKKRYELTCFGTRLQGQLMVQWVADKKLHWKLKRALTK